MSQHVARLWPELLDLEGTLKGLTDRPHVVRAAADPAHVEKIVDERLAAKDRERELEERMRWR